MAPDPAAWLLALLAIGTAALGVVALRLARRQRELLRQLRRLNAAIAGLPAAPTDPAASPATLRATANELSAWRNAGLLWAALVVLLCLALAGYIAYRYGGPLLQA